MRYVILVVGLFLCSCDGENSWAGTDQNPGGIWVGPEYVLIIAEDGRAIWWDPLAENFGDGIATVHIDNLSLIFNMHGPGDPAPASCVGTGTVRGRQSMTLTIECLSGSDIELTSYSEATLVYETTYNRDSSMVTIEGLYDIFGNGTEIIDINVDGTLFSQDSVTDCVTSGRVSIIDSNYNLYDNSVTVSECNAANEELNGLTSSGFLVLDNEIQPGTELLLYIGITDNAGDIYGVWFEAPKL